MRINHNIAALNTHRQLGTANANQSKSMEKLSSGLRINNAADDAAGLAISEKMRAQVRGLDQASANAQDAISLIQTAEGALNETTSILQRMRELATQASTDTNTTTDRGEIQKEMDSLTSEINRIGNTTEFNTQKLLNGAKDTGTEAVAADQVTVAGLTFDTSGGALEGYTFELGAVAASTTEAATVDTVNKTITIDGTFTGTAAVTNGDLEAAINAALKAEGITQEVSVGGTAAVAVTGTKSDAVTGGADAGAGLQFQIGANENQSLTLEIADMRAGALKLTGTGDGFTTGKNVSNGTDSDGIESGLDVSNSKNASAAITKIQAAIDNVSAERSKLGANQNRLDHTINNLGTSSENLTAAESRIRDVDMAKEMMNQTKESILAQASQAMLAQANQKPQAVLQLLQ